MLLSLISIIKWWETFSLFTHIYLSLFLQFSSVQLLSRVWIFATPWTTAHQASLSITNSWSSPKTHVRWVSDAIQPSHPLSPPSPPALNPYIPIKPSAISWILGIQTPARNSKRISIRNIWLLVDNTGIGTAVMFIFCMILYDIQGVHLWVHVTESGFVGWILY